MSEINITKENQKAIDMAKNSIQWLKGNGEEVPEPVGYWHSSSPNILIVEFARPGGLSVAVQSCDDGEYKVVGLATPDHCSYGLEFFK